jgi:hypothetical protein
MYYTMYTYMYYICTYMYYTMYTYMYYMSHIFLTASHICAKSKVIHVYILINPVFIITQAQAHKHT